MLKAASPARLLGRRLGVRPRARRTSTRATPLTNAQAAAYKAQGFEIALHVNTDCAELDAAVARSDLHEPARAASARRTRAFRAPTTNRTHCIAWSDYGDASRRSSSTHGIRLDTNYYYWPPTWVQNRPGMFTGSGMPMRFAESTAR